MLWKKPSGQQIETVENKRTIEYCESLGWKQVKAQPKKKAAKPQSDE